MRMTMIKMLGGLDEMVWEILDSGMLDNPL